jgi:para-nitrobenzyl esterase
MESMYCPTASHTSAIQTSAPIAAALGCTDEPSAAACAQAKSTADILAATGHLSMAGETGFMAGPNFGNSLLPIQASDALNSGQWNHSNIMIGSNRDDASSFVSGALNGKVRFPMAVDEYQMLGTALYGSFAQAVLNEYPLSGYDDPFLAYADEINDYSLLGCAVTPLSQMFAAAAPTFRYEFDDRAAPVPGGNPPNMTLGAYHGSELFYLFKKSNVSKTATQLQLSSQMMRYWTNFAKTGNPNGSDLVFWPFYDANSHQMLSLNPDGNNAINNFDVEHHCAFWAAAPGPPFPR